MSNYAKTKRIPLESATKEEIIAAVDSSFVFANIERQKMESAIYWHRCHSLLAEMHRLCDVMSENCQRDDKPHCPKRRERWNSASRRWAKINAIAVAPPTQDSNEETK